MQREVHTAQEEQRSQEGGAVLCSTRRFHLPGLVWKQSFRILSTRVDKGQHPGLVRAGRPLLLHTDAPPCKHPCHGAEACHQRGSSKQNSLIGWRGRGLRGSLMRVPVPLSASARPPHGRQHSTLANLSVSVSFGRLAASCVHQILGGPGQEI